MLYGFLFFLLSDIILLILRIPGIIRGDNIFLYRKWSFIIIASVSSLLIIGGFINAIIPVTREYNITINKPAGSVKTLRIAAVSDIHLGSIIRKRSLKKLSGMIKDMKPDLVLLLGDIVDGEIGPVLRGDLCSILHVRSAPMGCMQLPVITNLLEVRIVQFHILKAKV